ncbi:MAG TPA: hypothetical protein VK166_13025 [Chitinophagaceae bacterium]|nr:hypothetical protein [Chitinophagaceae bacterium]
MLKLIYAAMLLLLSSAAFLFSKEKEEFNCARSISGVVKEQKDETGFYLYIQTDDNKIYYPYIEKENVVLASGTKVRVCYDSTGTTSHGQPLIKINHLSFLP